MTTQEFRFTSHLKPGQTACPHCCKHDTIGQVPGLYVLPHGAFDPKAQILNLCTNCFGTGVDLALLRFGAEADYERDKATLENLLKQAQERNRRLTERTLPEFEKGLRHLLALKQLEVIVELEKIGPRIPGIVMIAKERPETFLAHLDVLSTLFEMADAVHFVGTHTETNQETKRPSFKNRFDALMKEGLSPLARRKRVFELICEAASVLEWLYPLPRTDTVLRGQLNSNLLRTLEIAFRHEDQKIQTSAAAQQGDWAQALAAPVYDAWVRAERPEPCVAATLIREMREQLLPLFAVREHRAFTEEELAPYAIQENKEYPPPAGLTPELIAHLFDATRKYGEYDAQEHSVRLTSKLGLSLCVSTRPGVHSMILMAGSQSSQAGMHVLSLRGTGQQNAVVFWDKRLTVKQVAHLLSEIDALAATNGYFDFETGERLPIDRTMSPGTARYSASQLAEGGVMPVFPGQDADELRHQFDDPEQIVAIEQPLGGGLVLCHVSQMQAQVLHAETVARELARRGITLEKIAAMSVAEVVRLREEMQTLFSKPSVP